MKEDRTRWNAKFMDRDKDGEPSSWVVTMCMAAPGKRALDLAAGMGRNAAFLAGQGFEVLALDLADKAVRSLKAQNMSGLFPVQADLDDYPLRPESFDLIVCCMFLDRKLFPSIVESLRSGGIVLYETAMESDLPGMKQISNRNYLLRTNELLHMFFRLRILSYQEVAVPDDKEGGKKVIARLAAQKGWTGDVPLEHIMKTR